jgi:hypothetical protein
MHRGLLVADQDVLDRLLMEQGVVDREHGAAGIAEEGVDPLILQGADHHLGAGHRLAHGRGSFRISGSSGSVAGQNPGNKKGPGGGLCAIVGCDGVLSPIRRRRLQYENKRAHECGSRDPKLPGR